MLNKLGSNQLLVIALLCAPLLLLQGLWLAFTSTLLTLLIILATSLLGFGLLSMLTLRLQQAERSHGPVAKVGTQQHPCSGPQARVGHRLPDHVHASCDGKTAHRRAGM